MILNDKEITAKHLLSPFQDFQVKQDLNGNKLISYGLSSFGYDICLSDREIKVFSNANKREVNPKNFDDFCLVDSQIFKDEYGEFFVLEGNTCALGVSRELFSIPDNVLGVCLGKSTYARCGILINITPLEPGWEGFLTIEISNTSPNNCRIYLNEGIAQLIFLEGNQPRVTYKDRQGKYQNQGESISLPKV